MCRPMSSDIANVIAPSKELPLPKRMSWQIAVMGRFATQCCEGGRSRDDTTLICRLESGLPESYRDALRGAH